MTPGAWIILTVTAAAMALCAAWRISAMIRGFLAAIPDDER